MKTKLSLILGAAFLACQVVTGWAATTTTFTVSATIPTATGIGITVSSANSATNVFTTLASGTTALTFNPMTFNTTNNIYLPDHYFVLDFAPTGGAGTADVTVGYTEGTNPNGATNGLGFKTTATFAKEVPAAGGTNTETLLTAHGPKKRLIDLTTPEHVAFTEVQPGFPRVYLGVWTGSTTGTAPDPSNGQPFSNGDAPGTYTGSLIVTTTVN